MLLQAQLTRSTVAEEANLAEIQRLAASAADMQAELAFRPTRADIDDLSAVVGQLRAELAARDQRERPPRDVATADKAVETDAPSDAAEPVEPAVDARKISADIDEMFRLDYDDDDEETDSAVTEINKDEDGTAPCGEDAEDGSAGTGSAGSFVRLDDSARLQVTLGNGSLHALEEELVRAKERWAEVAEERARLAAQLAALHAKPRAPALAHALALLLPVLAACLFYLLLPYIS